MDGRGGGRDFSFRQTQQGSKKNFVAKKNPSHTFSLDERNGACRLLVDAAKIPTEPFSLILSQN